MSKNNNEEQTSEIKIVKETEPLTIKSFLNEKYLQIPKYQRSYSWQKNNCTEFINDIFESKESEFNNNYYLGLFYTSHFTGNKVLILDGQQRLTSFFILLKELSLYWQNIPDNCVDFSEIKKFCLNKENFDKYLLNRLKLDDGNDEVFQAYLNEKDIQYANIKI